MEIREIFEKFEQIGCCTFATIDRGYPETRIAHFLACDDEGLYFMTMTTKPFYRQLRETGRVSVCGMNADPAVQAVGENGMQFDAGYSIRLSGDVREVSLDEIRARHNPDFAYCEEDTARYPAMTTFVLYRARGEIYDYDYEKEHRDHKLERERFSFGGFGYDEPGLTITDSCIGCGACIRVCTFDAVEKAGDRCRIIGSRCDECGNCFMVCPAAAIVHKGLPAE